MEEVKSIISQRLRRASAGNIVTPKEFLSLGFRTAVDKTFSRLAAAGKVIRVARGMYVAPRKASSALTRRLRRKSSARTEKSLASGLFPAAQGRPMT